MVITNSYDVLNRLTNRSSVSGYKVTFAYSPTGQRTNMTDVSGTNSYVYDNRDRLLTNATPQGTLTKVFCYGLDLISQRDASSGVLNYYGYDGNGNTRYLTGTNAAISDTYFYDAFGTTLTNTGTTTNFYRFAGEQFDSNLGFYYQRARYLNANSGRFVSRDSFAGHQANPMSLHRYYYCADDPVNKIDPSGHDYALGVSLTTLSVSSTLGGINFSPPVTSASKLSSLYSVAWGASRALTEGEINLARTVFGDSINYAKTGVHYGKWKFFQPKGREMTPDGIIHTGGETINDYTVAGSKPDFDLPLIFQQGILIHELAHVWQHQMGVNLLKKGLYRNYEYAGPNFGRLAFSDYGIEQQAQMTEDYFYIRNGEYRSSTIPFPTPSLSTYEAIIPFLSR